MPAPTSPLRAYVSALSAALEAVDQADLPDDGSNLPLRFEDPSGNEGGTVRHRTFHFAAPLSWDWKRGHGAALPELGYSIRLVVWCHRENRTPTDQAFAVLELAAAVSRVYLALTEAQPAGVQSAVLGRGSYDPLTGRMEFPIAVATLEQAS